MPAVDTNVLLRLLLDDDEDQARAAHSLQQTHAPLFVSHVVLAEMAWVLASAYGFKRDRLRTLVQMLLETDGISLQEPQLVRAALAAFEVSRADFSDCLILAAAESAGMAPLATFDERLAKLPGTRKLGRKRRRP
jgi:predicted nucleic-acid-binding protein